MSFPPAAKQHCSAVLLSANSAYNRIPFIFLAATKNFNYVHYHNYLMYIFPFTTSALKDDKGFGGGPDTIRPSKSKKAAWQGQTSPFLCASHSTMHPK